MIRGFHLIELLLVLTVIGIIAAFSIPLYSNYLAQSRRLEAEILLSKLAIAMEKYQFEHQSYQNATLDNLSFPDTPPKYYQFTIQSATEEDYLLVAKPQAYQAKSDKRCGALTLDAQGRKGITGFGSLDECW